MNTIEKEIVKAALENIFSGTERFENEDNTTYITRMSTSSKNGCHTIMRLLESNENNKQIVGNVLLFLEKHDFLSDEITEILSAMKTYSFTGN